MVESVLEPHWIGADNPNTTTDSTAVTWLDGTSSNNFLPWDSASNQPNDCDGPDQPETCIFLGSPSTDYTNCLLIAAHCRPHLLPCLLIPPVLYNDRSILSELGFVGAGPYGAWFDFQCAPKNPATMVNKNNGELQ